MTARIVMRLRVEDARPTTPEVLLLTLRHATKPELPAWAPGAHVDLRLPDGRVRQYSLCGDPAERGQWRLAVKREEAGRGGSRWVHEALRAGETVMVTAPRNNFPLVEAAERHVLVAGGIGITPLLPMARELTRRGAEFSLHFLARSRALAPLLAEAAAACGDRLVTWFGDDGRRFDPSVLRPPGPSDHLYACGPQRLLDALKETGWPEERFHHEVFQATLDENFKPEPFTARIAATGEEILVPAELSLLEALRRAGHAAPSSCESGVCGACICRYRDGVVIHRDQVLKPAERQDRMTPCVSRARVSVTLEL